MGNKKMNIKEFKDFGYLQELNRRFLHPLGLALEVAFDQKEEKWILGGIQDHREEGIYFGFEDYNGKEKREALEKYSNVEHENIKRKEERINELGFYIESFPNF